MYRIRYAIDFEFKFEFQIGPQGPREDSGFSSQVDPGLALLSELYTYTHKFHPQLTRIMASGLRTAEDALAVAGCDYLVLNPKVLQALKDMPTTQGYNDGLSAAAAAGGGGGGFDRVLSPQGAQAARIDASDSITESDFNERMDLAGRELLATGLLGLRQDVDRVVPFIKRRTGGNE